MKVPSMKDVIDGIIQHHIYRSGYKVSLVPYIGQEEKDEAFKTIKTTWMEIFKAAKFENPDQPIKSEYITNPYIKVSQLILFMYSLH